jgi:NAD(P)-dependent dehydrogenase (short-subunit alcohol dehydrogenase family)
MRVEGGVAHQEAVVGQAYFGTVAAVTPVRRIGTPEDVADAIVYLAAAGFVTGTVLECTGGSNLTAAALAT